MAEMLRPGGLFASRSRRSPSYWFHLAPHFAEELFEQLGGTGFATCATWPVSNPALLVEDQVTISVQVSGKMRGRITIERGSTEAVALEAAQAEPRVSAHLDNKTLRRVIWVPDRLLNLVVS